MSQIDYEDRKAVYESALSAWGRVMQSIVAIEEQAELIKEICKELRGQGNVYNMAEETADVSIMLEQLRLMYDLDADVEMHMERKIQRLQERLKKGREKNA